MSLQSTLSGLLSQAAQSGQTQPWILGKGLRVRVAANPDRLCLWRDEGEWGPGEASEREGHTCAKVLGWEYALRWQGKYLIVERQAALLAAAQ
ncbi:hypothetical protein [Deinococcus wulumuqiensis]|uniref:hypothetical protein n=1 Tax=Deinococcus wulumuqiensis TaxID=980427 RepID=UPI0024327EA1|nr:hypothetical protein [Deinococcus wulumuqiensis]